MASKYLKLSILFVGLLVYSLSVAAQLYTYRDENIKLSYKIEKVGKAIMFQGILYNMTSNELFVPTDTCIVSDFIPGSIYIEAGLVYYSFDSRYGPHKLLKLMPNDSCRYYAQKQLTNDLKKEIVLNFQYLNPGKYSHRIRNVISKSLFADSITKENHNPVFEIEYPIFYKYHDWVHLSVNELL